MMNESLGDIPMNKFDKFECLDCDGNGVVIASTGDGEIHEWECPECNNGWVDHKAHLVQEDCHKEFNKVMAEERL